MEKRALKNYQAANKLEPVSGEEREERLTIIKDSLRGLEGWANDITEVFHECVKQHIFANQTANITRNQRTKEYLMLDVRA